MERGLKPGHPCRAEESMLVIECKKIVLEPATAAGWRPVGPAYWRFSLIRSSNPPDPDVRISFPPVFNRLPQTTPRLPQTHPRSPKAKGRNGPPARIRLMKNPNQPRTPSQALRGSRRPPVKDLSGCAPRLRFGPLPRRQPRPHAAGGAACTARRARRNTPGINKLPFDPNK